ncbi:MAG: ribonuclease D [Myxococcota bacterium]
MIRDPAALDALLPRLASARRVALDTEFHTERHFHPRVMLLQVLPEGGEPALIDPLAAIDLRGLGDALADVEVLVHGGQMDVQILRDLTGRAPRAVFDTQVAAAFVGDGWPVRLQELARRHLGLHMPKTETLSDWSRRPLSAAQIAYARDDVRVLPPLADALLAQLGARGSEGFARDCLAEMYARALEPPDDDVAWRSVAGAHLLDDTERAVLQSLTAWRDRRARQLDVPRQNVLSDALLLDLSRRRPVTVEDMRANRRMPSQATRRDAADILERVAVGSAATPPPPLRARPVHVTDLLRAAARVAERATGVSADLVLDDDTMTKLANGQPIAAWRKCALGSDFFEFLEGGTGLVWPGVFAARDKF